MSKKIYFSDEARQSMFNGMKKVADAVRITMGPMGRNVVFVNNAGSVQVTNDGVTVAKSIELEDPLENMGASLIKEAASKANDQAGDGTTTATLLTYAMVKEGLREVRSGVNAIELKNGMKKAGELVVKQLKEISKPITTQDEISQVATISSQDPEVGRIIADAMEKVGKDGVITVALGQGTGITVEVTEGMKYSQGYISPYMVTDNEKMEARIDNPHILVTDKKISSLKDIMNVLEGLVNQGIRELVIVADDVDGEALPSIIMNKANGVMNILAVRAPGYGNNRHAHLQDFAALTGAKLISDTVGISLTDATVDMLGSAKSVIATKDSTTVISGGGSVADRLVVLRAEHDKADEYQKTLLAERIARLAGGVAVITVGANTQVEMKEKQLRIEDALNATKAAVAEGIVPGGGMALLISSIENALAYDDEDNGVSSDYIGFDIVIRALRYPFIQIVENAGKNGDVIIDHLLQKPEGTGYNAATHSYVNMIEAGIIDPTKVTRCALENAISIAGMFLTTESAIVEIPEKNTPNEQY